jgi:transposase
LIDLSFGLAEKNNWSETVEERTPNWSADDTAKLLHRYLIEKGPVSKLCEQAQLAPSMFHRWQELWFLNAPLALQGNRSPERNLDQRRIEKLERQNDEVLADLMAEHVRLKKELGEL